MEHLARAHHDLLGGSAIVPHQEPQRTLEDIGELFVRVRVLRDDAALLQVHVREHHLVTGDQATRKLLMQLFAGDLVPAIPGGLGAHYFADGKWRMSEATISGTGSFPESQSWTSVGHTPSFSASRTFTHEMRSNSRFS